MATPLSAIGKYAGVLMAVMCVLLMFAFVIGDPLMQYANSSASGISSRSAETVAVWNGGQMNERQIDQAVIHRNVLAEFQETVLQLGARAAMEDGVDVQFTGPRVRPIPLPRTREQGVERDVVLTRIFAQKARDAGMVVSDEMIVDYLQGLGFDRVSNDQMRQILARMQTGGGRRATITFVFDLLRDAMLSRNFLVSHAYLFGTVLPEERWEDWKKVNERVVVEAAPIDIAQFIDEVEDPTDAELEAFFEEHRDRVPGPEFLQQYGNVELPSPTPGFSTPRRVKLSVLKADFNVIADQLLEEISDEQVAEYYEANKDSFVAAGRGLFGDDSLFGPDDLLSGDPVDKPADEEPADDEPVMEDLPGAEEPQADEAGTDTDPPTEEPVAEEAPTDEPAAAEAKDADQQPAAEEPSVDEPSAETSAAEAPKDEQPQPDAVEEPTDPSSQTEAAEEEEEEEEAEEDPAASDKPADEAAMDTIAYQPLEEVADEIRSRLASERAAARLQEKMTRVKGMLEDSYVEYFDARLESEAKVADGQDVDVPPPPAELADLQPVAEGEQLELIEIDQAPQLELRESPIGRSLLTDPASGQTVPLWYSAFREDDVDLFQPVLSYDVDGTRYLVLVTERYEAKTPDLADVREEVVAAWKRVKAADLALQAAEAAAEQITTAGKSIAMYLTEKPEAAPVTADAVVETDAFALFSIGQVAPTGQNVNLRLSQPEPLAAPGPALLETIFDLAPGQVGAELNHDRSIAYLVRIAQQIGTPDELRGQFLRAGDRWLGANSLMQARNVNNSNVLLNDLLNQSGLEWLREADQVR